MEDVKLNQDAAAEVGTAHLAGPQFYGSLLIFHKLALSFCCISKLYSSLLTSYVTLHLQQLPDSITLNNMFLESHNMDIKDEEPQSTDFEIQKPNNKEVLELSAVMAYSLYATGMHATALMPKYYLRTILVLLAISLTCFFAVKVFYKKLPHQIANLATSLAIACNGISVLLFVGFIFAII